MFGAYFLAGLVPLLAIIIFPMSYSRDVAIVAALSCLLVLGYAKGKIVRVPPIRSAVEVLLIGGIATAIGIIAGNIFSV
jgi:VIT family.